MGDQQQENLNLSGPQMPPTTSAGELDVAGKSLSDALRISFGALKVIMWILVVVYLLSGFRTVESGEEALVLRFGKIRGVGDGRVLKPGLHWILPYPIDRIVKIPVGQKVNLAVNSFWYHQTKQEILSGQERRIRPGEPLRPVIDGYSLTRGENRGAPVGGTDGNDYGIVHCKWELTYRIADAETFFRNVYVEQPRPGQTYSDMIADSVNPLLRRLIEDAVVTALVNYTIDQVKFEQVAKVTSNVRELVQDGLDDLGTGIAVVSLQLTESTWPRQVDAAFQASISASQASEQAISEARTYSGKTLNEAAGPVAEELFRVLKDESVDEQVKEEIWSHVAGEARQRIAEARAYRTEVVESAKASADYVKQILPEYRKRPELVLQRIYVDAMEHILMNADEKLVLQPSEASGQREIRVLLSRDPSLKPKGDKGAGRASK